MPTRHRPKGNGLRYLAVVAGLAFALSVSVWVVVTPASDAMGGSGAGHAPRRLAPVGHGIGVREPGGRASAGPKTERHFDPGAGAPLEVP